MKPRLSLSGKRFSLPLGGRKEFFKNFKVDALALVLALLLFGYIGSAVAMRSIQPFAPIATDSMEPAIGQGSMALIKRVPAAELAAGDVIVFSTAEELRPPNYPSIRLAHRVVRVEEDPTAGLVFWTKGDALEGMDPFGTPARLVHGKVVLTIPFAGYVFHIPGFFTSPPGWAFLAMVLVLWIVIFHPYALRRWGNTIATGQIVSSDPSLKEFIEDLERRRAGQEGKYLEALARAAEVQEAFSENVKLHLEVQGEQVRAAREIARAAQMLQKSSRRKRRNKRKKRK